MTAKLYKVGDRVRIKTEAELLASGWNMEGEGFIGPKVSGTKDCRYYYINDTEGAIIGKDMLVRLVGRCYQMEGQGDYSFHDEMIAGLAEEEVETVYSKPEEIKNDWIQAEKEYFQLQGMAYAGQSKSIKNTIDLTPPVTEVEQIISARITKTQETLVEKAKQYAKNGRLGNFYDIAEFNETTPEKAAMILLSKHFVALKDYVNQPEGVPMEQWEEKIGDIICYLHLLEAIIKVKK